MATWYILVDGDVADPLDVTADANGVLRHKDGRAVDYRPHGPRSRMVDADLERAKMAQAKVRSNAVAPRDMKPATSGTYRTRETKAG